MVFPERLREGDTVGLVPPAFPVKEKERDGYVKLLEGMGYRVKLGACLESMYNFHNYPAGGAGVRGEDINHIFADPQVKVVLCVQGGYGSSQIIEYLGFDLVKQDPKIFVGYSDITNLYSASQMFGNLVTFHGPMVCSDMLKDLGAYTRPSLSAALNMEEELEFRNPPSEEGFKAIRGGEAESILAGGNISVLARAYGAFYQLDTRDKVLFLGDVEEGTASLDMYIIRTEYARMSEHTVGILLGDFTDCTNDQCNGTYRIKELLHNRFGIFDLSMMYYTRPGHDKSMGTLPFGTVYRTDGDNRRLRFYRQLRQIQRKIQQYIQRQVLWQTMALSQPWRDLSQVPK